MQGETLPAGFRRPLTRAASEHVLKTAGQPEKAPGDGDCTCSLPTGY